MAERAQLNFAAAASHELRTPLHQIAAAASLIKGSIHSLFNGSGAAPPHDSETISSASQTINTPELSSSPTGGIGRMATDEQREEVYNQLEIIDFNGQALSQILGNIIDTLISVVQWPLPPKGICKPPACPRAIKGTARQDCRPRRRGRECRRASG